MSGSASERRLAFVLPPAAAGLRLDRAIAEFAPGEPALSRARVQALLKTGKVRLDGGLPRGAACLARPGAAVEIEIPKAAPAIPQAEDLPLEVLFEDAHLIVVDKPVGMAAHPAPGTPSGTLVNALLFRCRDRLSGVGGVLRPGIVHRLDKDTSGVMVAAKTDAAHQGLCKLFAARDLDRRYLALASRGPNAAAGRIETRLGRAPYDRQRMAVLKSGGREARTTYRVERRYFAGPADPRPLASRIVLSLETGRTHQIRVHLAHLGAPVLGDPLYGRGRPASASLAEALSAAGLARQALHAFRLGFAHPLTGERLSFETAPPADMRVLESELERRFFCAAEAAKP